MPHAERGPRTPIEHDSECTGMAVRTRENVMCVYVCVGHGLSLETAVEIALAGCAGSRIPVPTRRADKLVAREKTQVQTCCRSRTHPDRDLLSLASQGAMRQSTGFGVERDPISPGSSSARKGRAPGTSAKRSSLASRRVVPVTGPGSRPEFAAPLTWLAVRLWIHPIDRSAVVQAARCVGPIVRLVTVHRTAVNTRCLCRVRRGHC